MFSPESKRGVSVDEQMQIASDAAHGAVQSYYFELIKADKKERVSQTFLEFIESVAKQFPSVIEMRHVAEQPVHQGRTLQTLRELSFFLPKTNEHFIAHAYQTNSSGKPDTDIFLTALDYSPIMYHPIHENHEDQAITTYVTMGNIVTSLPEDIFGSLSDIDRERIGLVIAHSHTRDDILSDHYPRIKQRINNMGNIIASTRKGKKTPFIPVPETEPEVGYFVPERKVVRVQQKDRRTIFRGVIREPDLQTAVELQEQEFITVVNPLRLALFIAI